MGQQVKSREVVLPGEPLYDSLHTNCVQVFLAFLDAQKNIDNPSEWAEFAKCQKKDRRLFESSYLDELLYADYYATAGYEILGIDADRDHGSAVVCYKEVARRSGGNMIRLQAADTVSYNLSRIGKYWFVLDPPPRRVPRDGLRAAFLWLKENVVKEKVRFVVAPGRVKTLKELQENISQTLKTLDGDSP